MNSLLFLERETVRCACTKELGVEGERVKRSDSFRFLPAAQSQKFTDKIVEKFQTDTKGPKKIQGGFLATPQFGPFTEVPAGFERGQLERLTEVKSVERQKEGSM